MNQPSNTPWWLPSDEVKQVRVVQTKSNSNFIVIAVVIALIAGAIGAMVGRSSSTNIGANLVDTKNIVERAPDSIAALAARVIPAVVSISINSSSGSGFFLDSDGFILISQMMASTEFHTLVFVLKTMETEQSKLLKETLQELQREINAMAECA